MAPGTAAPSGGGSTATGDWVTQDQFTQEMDGVTTSLAKIEMATGAHKMKSKRKLRLADGEISWSFDDCAEEKYYVCEQTNACPSHAYPCYHQPDANLDWCQPLLLTDAECQNEGTPPMMPSMAIGYMNYIFRVVVGPSATHLM